MDPATLFFQVVQTALSAAALWVGFRALQNSTALPREVRAQNANGLLELERSPNAARHAWTEGQKAA